jgi:hypothetical protein
LASEGLDQPVLVKMQIGLKADDAEDRRGVGTGNGRRGHGGGELPFGGHHARKLGLEDPRDIGDRGVNEDIQAHRVDRRIHGEALAAQPGDDPVEIALQRQVGRFELRLSDLRPAADTGVKVQGVAHLQADGEAHRGRQFARGQRRPDHLGTSRLSLR